MCERFVGRPGFVASVFKDKWKGIKRDSRMFEGNALIWVFMVFYTKKVQVEKKQNIQK